MPLGWRANILNDGNLPGREEHIFAYEIEPNPNHPEKRFAYYKSRGKITLKEAYVTGMYIWYFFNLFIRNILSNSRKNAVFIYRPYLKYFCSKWAWKLFCWHGKNTNS